VFAALASQPRHQYNGQHTAENQNWFAAESFESYDRLHTTPGVSNVICREYFVKNTHYFFQQGPINLQRFFL
jgi:hypothetical protein